MRTKVVAGNWKMNGDQAFTRSLLTSLLDQLGGDGRPSCEVIICPPAILLTTAREALGGSTQGSNALGDRVPGSSFIQLGAQTVSEHEVGAFTGELAPSMLADAGCSHVIVGHSERRTLYGEADRHVVAKFKAAQAHDLTPILCVGETLQERQSGTTQVVIERQIRALLNELGVAALSSAIIAYEPVWAIGTGETATPAQAQEVHARIRQLVASRDMAVASGLRILYGGSVKADNAAELFSAPDIDGGLIGGASLKADEFAAICRAGSNR
ncbi:MAG: triose-phosphate isomerase [Gammaproteobacteria bacterium]|nr:triose-phosphate isomerase [Gammaproteobacteria bacterium]